MIMPELTPEQVENVIKRNRRSPRPPVGLDRMLALSEPRKRGLYRADPNLALHEDNGTGWHQPGRRYGPRPLGPDVPKRNKVTDKDGNPRIMPLSADQRYVRYAKQTGRQVARPNPYAGEGDLAPQLRAALLGVTPRQYKRIVKKANHVTRPGQP